MQCKSYSHFFSKKFQHICVSLDVNFNESLISDVVSFQPLGPGVFQGGSQWAGTFITHLKDVLSDLDFFLSNVWNFLSSMSRNKKNIFHPSRFFLIQLGKGQTNISGVVARWEMLGFSKNPTFTFSFYFQFFLTFDLVVLLPVFLPASILEPLPPLVLDLVIRISLLAPNENILLESFSVQTGGDSWVFEITPWRFSFWSSGLRVFLGTFVAFKISVKGASLFAELERTFKILSERVTLSSILNLHCFRLWWKTAFPRNKLSLNQQYRNTHNYRNIPKETKIYRIAPKYTKQRRYIK